MRPWLDPSFSSICIREWGGFFTLANKDRAVCCASILKTRWGRKIFMHALNCLSEGWPQRTDSQMLWTWSPCAPCTPRGLWALDIVAWEPTVPKPGSYLWKKLDLSSFSLSLSETHAHAQISVQRLHNSHLDNVLKPNSVVTFCLPTRTEPYVRLKGLCALSEIPPENNVGEDVVKERSKSLSFQSMCTNTSLEAALIITNTSQGRLKEHFKKKKRFRFLLYQRIFLYSLGENLTYVNRQKVSTFLIKMENEKDFITALLHIRAQTMSLF